MDTFALNPLMIFSVQPVIVKDPENKPVKHQPVTLSLSTGFRLAVTQKTDVHPTAPDIDGWTGTFSLLAGIEYAPKKQIGPKKGENKWEISAKRHGIISATSIRPHSLHVQTITALR
jgi:hypothetical protein